MGEFKAFFKHVVENINTIIVVFSALCGFILQYSFSTDKGLRPALFMFVCTAFTAGVLHFILQHYNINAGDGLHTASMIFSTFISVGVISLFVAVLSLVNKKAPEALITRIADEIINRGKPTADSRERNNRSRPKHNYDQGEETTEVDPYE